MCETVKACLVHFDIVGKPQVCQEAGNRSRKKIFLANKYNHIAPLTYPYSCGIAAQISQEAKAWIQIQERKPRPGPRAKRKCYVNK